MPCPYNNKKIVAKAFHLTRNLAEQRLRKYKLFVGCNKTQLALTQRGGYVLVPRGAERQRLVKTTARDSIAFV